MLVKIAEDVSGPDDFAHYLGTHQICRGTEQTLRPGNKICYTVLIQGEQELSYLKLRFPWIEIIPEI